MVVNDTNAFIQLATFNAEKYWRSDQLALLPSLKDHSAEKIISTLDELQFVFCNQKDILFTRIKIDDIQIHYLYELGYRFTNDFLYDCINEGISCDNISKLLLGNNTPFNIYQESYYKKKLTFSPYAIDDFSLLLCQRFGLINSIPDIESVKIANSKFFSFNLHKNINSLYKGILVETSEEILQKGNEFLEKIGPFLIKDYFGVSGNGNILINTSNILENICNFLLKQEKIGKTSQFVLEPLYSKDIDFSCQLDIDCYGNFKYDSIQVMHNKGYAFQGIEEAQPEFYNYLEEKGYFNYIELIVKKIFETGYFGPVCVDSMKLQNGEIVPIIEINARRSMGLINSLLNRKISLNTCLFSYSLGIPEMLKYEDLFVELDKCGILFRLNRTNGIIPLSSLAFDININSNIKSIHKGKLYVAFVYQKSQSKKELMELLENVFSRLGIINYV